MTFPIAVWTCGVAAALAAVVQAAPAAAALVVLGPELRPTTRNLAEADPCRFSDGSTFVLDDSTRDPNSGQGSFLLLARWVADDGSVAAGPFVVNDVPAWNYSEVACAADGTALVIFQDRLRFVSRSGALGASRPICPDGLCEGFFWRVAAAAVGDRFFVAWLGVSGASVVGRYVSADGARDGSPVQIGDSDYFDDLRNLEVRGNAAGEAFVAWRVARDPGHSPYPWQQVDVRAAVVSADGRLTDREVLNRFPYSAQHELVVKQERGHRFLVAWNNDHFEAGWVARRVSTAEGNRTTTTTTTTTTLDPRSVEFLPSVRLASTAPGNWWDLDDDLRLAADAAGGWLASWTDGVAVVAKSIDEAQHWSPAAPIEGAVGPPAIASDGDRGWVVAWPTAGGVHIHRSDDAGLSWGDDEELLRRPLGDDELRIEHLSVATDGKGRWVSVWAEYLRRAVELPDGEHSGDEYVACSVVTSLSTDDGRSWRSPRVVEDLRCGDTWVQALRIVADGDRSWLLAWTNDGIVTSRSVDSAQTWSLPQPSGIDDASGSGNLAVATDGEGHWLVSFLRSYWRGEEYLGPPDLLVSRSDDVGQHWSEPARVAPWHDLPSGWDSSPSLAFADGLWGIAWQTNSGTGGIGFDADIVAAFSADTGASWSEPKAVASDASIDTRADQTPLLVAAGGGRWAVVWRTFEGLKQEVRLARARAGCGDGAVTGFEECDDGNLVDGDGCDSNCLPTGCGNGYVTSGEDCDDGNADESDECLSDCRVASCGDGFAQDGFEECDDGDADDTDDCLSTCTLPTCGDGVVHTGIEECDEGPQPEASGACPDGCRLATCGDNYLHLGVEQCDDGNSSNGDRCTKRCRVDPVCAPDLPEQNATASQALKVLRKAIGLRVRCPLATCDRDGNGVITAADALGALRIAVGLSFDICQRGSLRFRLESSVLLGALQVRLDYSRASGDVPGVVDRPACEVLAPLDSMHTLSAMGFDPGRGHFTFGLISLGGFQGPLDLVSCDYDALAGPDAYAFTVSVEDATGVNGEPIEPRPQIELVVE
ncbi:MAG: DUF4215 domain-containing protein [Candidatus Binatia bacterium]